MRFTLAPRSHKARLNLVLHIEQGMVKLPGSCNFGGSLFITIALTFLVKVTVSSSNFLLLEKISFKNFT
jgi:hypothetical protein